jgi:hypothetical protein
MNEPRRIFVGRLPSASEVFVDGVDPVGAMIAEASAALDRQRADEVKAAASKVADEARAKAMRRARISRRFLKVWKMFAKG